MQSPSMIRQEGYRVLTKEMGAVNAAIFIRQLESGSGNYTNERRAILEENSIDDIVARIKERKAQES